MSDDFEGIPLDQPAEVPAETQPDGAVTEDNTGEQVANEGGNPAWYDSTYPGQTTNSASTPTKDPYGLNILSAAETQQLTRNINPAFINNFTDPNAPTAAAATNAVNTSATNVPVYVDSNGVVFNSATGLSYPVDRTTGKQILPTDVADSIDPAAQNRINTFNQQPTISATPVNTGATISATTPVINTSATPVNTGATISATPSAVNTSATPVYTPSPYTETRQTAVEAAQLNAYSEIPNPYLTNIEKAGAEITKGEAGISTATQTIQSAQQKISTSESIIAQNNSELANPDISPARKAELEANNAAQVQNIFDQTQSVTENQAYIANTQDTIDANNVVINDNAAVYRDTTNPAQTTTVPINVDPNVTAAETATQTATAAIANPTTTAAPVNVNTAGLANVVATTVGATTANVTAAEAAAIQTQVGRQAAQQQAVLQAQKRIPNNSDWRVRLSLAPGAQYLYNAPTGPNGAGPGILWPLAQTGGVIFPYTPKIEMSYKADYESYALTHSNYKGYFYKSSYTDAVNMMATFTAQDTNEAQYLLAVIHFFRSVTKMFYGKDAEHGAPPPLVYLTGLGEYQFTRHPCVVTSFNYNLPSDVDYIRARSINVNGTDLLTRRNRQDLPTNPISGAVARLQNLFSSQGINKGALFYPPPVPNLGENQPTYVPTKLDISLSLLPVQTRSQVTNQFSLKDYSNGALLKGGFW